MLKIGDRNLGMKHQRFEMSSGVVTKDFKEIDVLAVESQNRWMGWIRKSEAVDEVDVDV
jgi:hypothetical protein